MYLKLILALLLPWIGGFAWLRYLEARLGDSGGANLWRQAGYGLFLGYAAVYALVLLYAATADAVRFWPLISLIAVASASGLLLLWRSGPQPPAQVSTIARLSPLAWILLAAIAAHLWLSYQEIINRPVYPWDAWQIWIYRAKAWFFSGSVYPLASSADWLAGTAQAPYALEAAHYPAFASVIPFWVALSLGSWSESLVNLPVIPCALAMLAGIYGSCRERGMAPLSSAASAYLLVSIPLIGTHLALAGYADIWLAGFTGLGFIAIIQGLSRGQWTTLSVGLALLALSGTVKNEGVIWFLGGLMMVLAFHLSWRILFRLMVAVAAACLVAALFDLSYIELPLLGGLGFSDGQVHIPFLGSHVLVFHDVGGAYLDSLFSRGTWNLLWYLVIASLLSLPFLHDRKLARAIALFALVPILSQAFIFAATAQGQWAESYTAINRLPLHFVPAFVFCIICCWQALYAKWRDNQRNHNLVIALATPVLAAVAVALIGYLTLLQPTQPLTPSTSFGPGDLRVLMGSGNNKPDGIHIEGYRNGIALISTGEVQLDAKSLDILAYDISWQGAKNPTFFWRSQAQPADVHTLEISGTGNSSILLRDHPQWSGTVSEAGLVFFDAAANSASVRGFTLHPAATRSLMQLLWHDWTSYEDWSLKSINWLQGGRDHQLAPAPIALALWLAITAVLYLITMSFRSDSGLALRGMGACVLLAWALLDARWIGNRIALIQELQLVNENRGGRPCLELGMDCEVLQLVSRSSAQLPRDHNARVLIVMADSRARFQALRAKYHLLPHAAEVAMKGTGDLTRSTYDLLILVGNDQELQTLSNGLQRLQQQPYNFQFTEIAKTAAGEAFLVGPQR